MTKTIDYFFGIGSPGPFSAWILSPRSLTSTTPRYGPMSSR